MKIELTRTVQMAIESNRGFEPALDASILPKKTATIKASGFLVDIGG